MLLRIGLALLTLHQGVAAVWAAFFPFGFFQNFPTPERGWLLLFPPYNEHMTRDFGFAGLPFVVVLAYALVVLRRPVVRMVLIASLFFSVPHLIYHQLHVIADSDVIVQLVSQLVPVLLALILLWINERANGPAGTTGEPAR